MATQNGPGLDRVRERVHTLPERFRSEAADGFSAGVALDIDRSPFGIVISRGSCSVFDRHPRGAAARVSSDSATWLALDEGAVSSIDPFLAGRLAVRGNVDLAVRLQSLFRFSARDRTPSDLEQVDVRANGHVLSAYVFGQGPPLLFLHGLGGSKLSWLPILAPLAQRYRIIAPDLPGHGESEKPRAPYTPQFFARVAARLLDAVGERSAVLVGNSLGGRIALEMAWRAPHRADALILLGPAIPGFRNTYLLQFLRVIPTELAAMPFPMRQRLAMAAIRQLMADPRAIPAAAYRAGADEFIRVHRSARARMAVLASLRALVAERPETLLPRIRKISAPTLILWGTHDRLVPVRLAERLVEAMPAATLHVLPGVGHVPQFEAPGVTLDLMMRFLEAQAVERPASA